MRRYFSEEGVRDEPLYGVVDVSREIDEDKVYGRLVDLRPSTSVSSPPVGLFFEHIETI